MVLVQAGPVCVSVRSRSLHVGMASLQYFLCSPPGKGWHLSLFQTQLFFVLGTFSPPGSILFAQCYHFGYLGIYLNTCVHFVPFMSPPYLVFAFMSCLVLSLMFETSVCLSPPPPHPTPPARILINLGLCDAAHPSPGRLDQQASPACAGAPPSGGDGGGRLW